MKHLKLTPSLRLAAIAYALFLILSMISRLILLAVARHVATWDASLITTFGLGLRHDAAAAVFASLPWIAIGATLPHKWLNARSGKILLMTLMTLFIGILVFITTAEYFFWDEFGARFNFIAVDYLVWTNEVWGNINESYPMVPIITGILLISLLTCWALNRIGAFQWVHSGQHTFRSRILSIAAGLAVAAGCVWFIDQSSANYLKNQYHCELAKNGCWSFFAAARHMQLDYDKWYLSFEKKAALKDAKQLLSTHDAPALSDAEDDLRRRITGRGPEKRWNVILVCMESMSGDFMSYLGEKSGITPNLDRLANQSVFFENLYATGTRTVRGMEALTLNLPPTPGQAIIYRPEGTNLQTSFSPFIDRGYDCAFFYGGDGRFDFMNRYFSTSGCRIMDVNAWDKNDVTFKTAWGACDEDLFRKTIAEADANHAAGKPFHFFCMTTSNHRPYDFPAGRIDLPSHSGRKAAVKYADWAIGNLIAEASKKPWFNNTLFVIVADHCASCAGKSEIDVTKHHIPGIIYNPSLVPAQKISKLSSQIDVMPTVLGMMNWSYDSLGYGHDLLAPSATATEGRAFVSNYQKIALLKNNGMAILKPNRVVSRYSCNLANGDLTPIEADRSNQLVHDAAVYYQSASWLFDNGKLKRKSTGATLSAK